MEAMASVAQSKVVKLGNETKRATDKLTAEYSRNEAKKPRSSKPHSRAPSDIRLQLWIDHAHHWDTRLRAITSFLKKCITKSHITPPNKLHQVAGSHPITCHRPINDPVTSQVLESSKQSLGKTSCFYAPSEVELQFGRLSATQGSAARLTTTHWKHIEKS